MIHPLFAILTPEIIGIVVIGALILFGADKLPKLARSAGQAKKEFTLGQIEADEAAARAREEARTRNADLMSNVEAGNIAGEPIPPPTPGKGTQA
jgi:TatA/E family protein of Tat protein translocase